MENLGDFRRGTMSLNYRKCGKKNCACARKDHPGHGPQYLWNAPIGGKTRARNLPLGPELEKVGKEVQTDQAFVRLTQEWMEINDRICQMRPVHSIENETELEELKKTAEAFRREAEINRLLARVLQDRQRLGHLDLEASEMAIRAAMHQMGGTLLQKLLHSDGGGYRGAHFDGGHGHSAEFARGKPILTVRSSVEVQRASYYGSACQSGWVPKDQELDVVGSSFRPGVRRRMAVSKQPLEQGRSDWEEWAGVVVGTKQVERISTPWGVQVEAFCRRERR
jgi:hypothetical protein